MNPLVDRSQLPETLQDSYGSLWITHCSYNPNKNKNHVVMLTAIVDGCLVVVVVAIVICRASRVWISIVIIQNATRIS